MGRPPDRLAPNDAGRWPLVGTSSTTEAKRRCCSWPEPQRQWSTNRVCRYGGEEFLAVLPGCIAEQAVVVLERVGSALQDALADASLPVFTVSYGVADVTDAADFTSMVAGAEHALLAAKRGGRDRAVLAHAGARRTSPWILPGRSTAFTSRRRAHEVAPAGHVVAAGPRSHRVGRPDGFPAVMRAQHAGEGEGTSPVRRWSVRAAGRRRTRPDSRPETPRTTRTDDGVVRGRGTEATGVA